MTWTLLSATVPQLVAAQTVSGEIIDVDTRQPVRGAVVTLVGSNDSNVARASTGRAGYFSVRADRAGSYRLRVESPGYHVLTLGAIELKADARWRQVIELKPLEPIQMDTVFVEGETKLVPWYLADFYRRRETARGLGSFLTTEDIEGFSPNNPSDLIRRLSGFTLGRDQVIQNLRNPSGCPPLVFVDGLPAPDILTADDLNTRLWIDIVAAAEAYHSPARVPTEFNRTGAACGVIVFWTRR